jgi:hypothetical protein
MLLEVVELAFDVLRNGLRAGILVVGGVVAGLSNAWALRVGTCALLLTLRWCALAAVLKNGDTEWYSLSFTAGRFS